MDMFDGITMESVALAAALLILLQLWIELRRILRDAGRARGGAFMQVQIRRDPPQTEQSSFRGKQPKPGDRDESRDTGNGPRHGA